MGIALIGLGVQLPPHRPQDAFPPRLGLLTRSRFAGRSGGPLIALGLRRTFGRLRRRHAFCSQAFCSQAFCGSAFCGSALIGGAFDRGAFSCDTLSGSTLSGNTFGSGLFGSGAFCSNTFSSRSFEGRAFGCGTFRLGARRRCGLRRQPLCGGLLRCSTFRLRTPFGRLTLGLLTLRLQPCGLTFLRLSSTLTFVRFSHPGCLGLGSCTGLRFRFGAGHRCHPLPFDPGDFDRLRCMACGLFACCPVRRLACRHLSFRSFARSLGGTGDLLCNVLGQGRRPHLRFQPFGVGARRCDLDL
ncbi:MAG: hypothetical protein KDG57_10235, partial [Rhodoferax sp.]|nr:hypothetical protein [Rhodoferax sp.]